MKKIIQLLTIALLVTISVDMQAQDEKKKKYRKQHLNAV